MDIRRIPWRRWWPPAALVAFILACGPAPDPGTSDAGGGWGEDADTDVDADTDTDTPEDTAAADTAADGEDTADTAPEDDCDTETPLVLYLSADDSTSMSSPVQARAAVLDGWTPLSWVSIRPWEFMNYASFGYEPAAEGTLRLDLQLEADPQDEARYRLQVAAVTPPATRQPLNLTFVIDTSGSMMGTPLDLVRTLGDVVAGQLRAGDVVSIVTWNDEDNVVVSGWEVAGPDDIPLRMAFQQVQAGGATDLYRGLVTGYAEAVRHYDPNRINRVVLVTDGGANVGVTEEDIIARHAAWNEDRNGIYLVGVGLGSSYTYFDEMLEKVTDKGRGASVFLDGDAEVRKVFGERFLNTLGVAARDVQVQLSLPPGFSIVRTTAEGVSMSPHSADPQLVAPDDAVVIHSDIATCAPDTVKAESQLGVAVRWTDPFTGEVHEEHLETTFGEALAGPVLQLHKGAAVAAGADALKAWKKDPRGAGERARQEALARLEVALADTPHDPDLLDLWLVMELLPGVRLSAEPPRRGHPNEGRLQVAGRMPR